MTYTFTDTVKGIIEKSFDLAREKKHPATDLAHLTLTTFQVAEEIDSEIYQQIETPMIKKIKQCAEDALSKINEWEPEGERLTDESFKETLVNARELQKRSNHSNIELRHLLYAIIIALTEKKIINEEESCTINLEMHNSTTQQ